MALLLQMLADASPLASAAARSDASAFLFVRHRVVAAWSNQRDCVHDARERRQRRTIKLDRTARGEVCNRQKSVGLSKEFSILDWVHMLPAPTMFFSWGMHAACKGATGFV